MARQKNRDTHQATYLRENVFAMPDGYYTADRPNPSLRAFVENHVRGGARNLSVDDYDIPGFDRPIQTTKATAIYNMHSYHQGKKPHDAIRQYVKHYTKPGDLVMDPFCGSGGTALAALMEGRKAIAIDRSPMATFITKNYCTPVDADGLEATFEQLKQKLRLELDSLYETRCDRCAGKASTAYTVYSQVFQCPRCMEKSPLFDCPEVEVQAKAGGGKKINVCPHCCARGFHEEISTRSKRFGAIPVQVSYICENGCKPQRSDRRYNDPDEIKRTYFEECDLARIKRIEDLQIPHWYPPNKMMNVDDDSKPWGAEWREGRNFRTVAELFTKRNLWAVAAILEEALKIPITNHRDLALAALTGTMLHLSRMSHHKEAGGGIMAGTYYLPQMSKERNALANYSSKLKEIVAAIRSGIDSINEEVYISTQSACSYPQIPAASVDYIFTDPPYADKVQYGELNFIWEAWLEFDTHWHNEEIVVNYVRGKTEHEWASRMHDAMAECYRVLKPIRFT